MPIPPTTVEALHAALLAFDADKRDAPEWRGWQERRSHCYAIEHDGCLYPVKEVIRLATGTAGFAGGSEANGYLQRYELRIVPLRPNAAPTAPRPRSTPTRRVRPAPPVGVAEELIAALRQRDRAEAPADFPSDRAAALQPGMYSWWADEAGRAELGAALDEPPVPPLIYAGLAGATKWACARDDRAGWSPRARHG